MDQRLRSDPFLAGFLGRPAYTLAVDGLDADALSQAVERLIAEGAFAQARTGAQDPALAAMLQQAGFRLADTNLILERPRGGIPEGGPDFLYRGARPEDERAVRQVAETGFRYSRLHLDPRIPREAADAFKGAWAGNFFAGKRGQAMIVAEDQGQVRGFLQLLRKGDLLVIDLVAVAEACRGRGAASGMIGHADSSLDGFSLWRTGTQAANIPSLRLYESLGFRMADAGYVFHFHGDKA